MVTIRIASEFMHGPVWCYNQDGIVTRIPSVLKNDNELQTLIEEASEMFDSYYEFDSHDQSCWYNIRKEREEAVKMLSLIQAIISRINELNDGSFIVDDCETNRLHALLS